MTGKWRKIGQLIGVDYHPSFQQIAFADTETGEFGERQLNHSDGEADRFYRHLKQRANRRAGWNGGHRVFALVRATAGRLGMELWMGDAAEIKTKRVRKQKTDRQDAQR